jgi:hypothetical protein
MTRHWDEMSAVRSVEFDRTTHTLRVGFESGAIYDFADVPERIYEELLRSPTPDVAFHRHVRDEFVSHRVGEIDLTEIAEERREDAILGPPLAEDVQLSRADERPLERSEGASATVRRSHHTWVVDVIDEDSAAVEVDGRQITPIPRWVLPADAHDGDVLRVTHARSGLRSALSIEIDRDAQRAALKRSAEQLSDIPVAGRGDVEL